MSVSSMAAEREGMFCCSLYQMSGGPDSSGELSIQVRFPIGDPWPRLKNQRWRGRTHLKRSAHADNPGMSGGQKTDIIW